MSGRASDDEADREAEWDPTFPWERGGELLRSTEAGRFATYNALLYGLVGVAFALPTGLQALGRETGGSRIVVMAPPSVEEAVVLSFRYALSVSPILAVVSGVLAGLFLGTSTATKAATGAIGVTAGVAALLVSVYGTALLLGVDVVGPRGRTVGPVASGVAAVLVGGGAAALTDAFRPTRPND